jgi:hypothetical protein
MSNKIVHLPLLFRMGYPCVSKEEKRLLSSEHLIIADLYTEDTQLSSINCKECILSEIEYSKRPDSIPVYTTNELTNRLKEIEFEQELDKLLK